MGMIFEDNEKGIHAEVRRESFVLYTDFGDERIELSYDKFEELKMLIQKIEDHIKQYES